ncbi:MAG: hypothetical protein AAF560_14090 [Acidobacteriota bacterium]
MNIETALQRRQRRLWRSFTLLVLACAVAWVPAAPAFANCPAGAPSCTAPYETTVIDWPMKIEGICDSLDGASYQANEEEPFEGTLGSRVYHPVDDDGFLLPGPLPLALMVPGNSYEYTDYENLMTHLASQGIVTVSMMTSSTASSGLRADVLICGLRNLFQEWNMSALNEQVAFLGHSRGGEAAVMAANRHGELVLAGEPYAEDVEIRAVVAIAPSANCADHSSACYSKNVSGYTYAHARLEDEAARSLLVIQGSRDGDVPADGFRIYEDASREGPGPLLDDMTKSMVWIYSVMHGSWTSTLASPPNSRTLVLARAYIGSYLNWWLKNEAHHRQYFTGEATPPCVADPAGCGLAFEPVEAFTQYREGTEYNGERLRVHDFEPPQPLDPSHIGSVNEGPMGSARVEDLLGFYDPYAHRVSTHAAVSTLGSDRESSLSFTTGNYTDFSPYAFLSVRLGKVILKTPGDTEADCEHVAPGDLTVAVSLQDWTQTSHEVLSSDYQRITDADLYWGPGGFGADPGCNGKQYLTTLRIPLLDFWQGGVNPNGVSLITLRFGTVPQDGYVHEVMVDSVELTRNDIDPYCGNDVTEGDEVCDNFPPVGESCLDYGYIGGDLGCSSACLPDFSNCIEAVCGNGMVEGDEECDDGNLSPYDDCNPDCTLCPPGEPLCRCLGSEPGEEDPSLPFNGVLGDGTYCNDDVLLGGLNRCVEMVGGAQACIPCMMDNGPFCPCDAFNDSCFANYDGAFDSDVTSPNPPPDADMQCSFSLKDPDAPGGLDPALNQGYCFANGATENQGGAPPWFQEWYCQSWHPQAMPQFDVGLGELCILP